jgi:ribulose-5-phosphate 4-epimerase/fuculose-1-phosphate aldolase
MLGQARLACPPNPGRNSLMDDGVRQLRIDLAAALRSAARLGLNEGIANHFSAAVPNDDGAPRGDRFLVNPWGLHWSEITASSLALCDADGKVLEGDCEVERSAFCIHSRIHLAVPQAVAVLHTHMPYATALACLEDGRLEMAEQNALRFYDRIAYDDDYAGIAFAVEEGDRMAAKMGNRGILFLANHGVVVTGNSIAMAFDDLYFLERAAQVQVLARSTGGRLRVLPDALARETREQMADCREAYAERHFGALKRTLDREAPEYRR